jgi:hemerythrin-like domain-containing protein
MTGLTVLGQVLHEEHFRILVCICDLKNRVSGETGEQSFDPDNDQEKDEMHGLIGSLDDTLAHHAFEEDIVFPLIRAEGGSDLADLLTAEHAAIEPTAKRLRALAVEILRHGPGKGRWAEFRAVATQLFSEMISHLEKEELTILQRLDSLLDAETDHRLALQHLSSRLLPAIRTGAGALR